MSGAHFSHSLEWPRGTMPHSWIHACGGAWQGLNTTLTTLNALAEHVRLKLVDTTAAELLRALSPSYRDTTFGHGWLL